MAALVVQTVGTFHLDGLRAHLAERLPAYARPLFLRFRTDLEIMRTFKPKKTLLVAEGFDPARTAEPVFFDDRGAGAYRPVDAASLDGLEAGTIRL